MKSYLKNMLGSRFFWIVLSLILIVRLGVATFPKAEPVPAPAATQPAPVSISTPESPYEREWQDIEVPSMRYTPLEAAERGCDKPFSQYSKKLTERYLGNGLYELFSHHVIRVELEGVTLDLEIQVTKDGVKIMSPSLPEGSIEDSYALEATYGRNLYYIQVKLQEEPDLENLTTPAQVWCRVW